MKILYANTYPTESALEEVLRGRYPAHHVWGIADLRKRGFEVGCLRYERWRWINRLARKARLGTWVDQQIRAFFRQNSFDVLYSANAGTSMLLGRLRTRGLFRRPIVSVFHNSLPTTATTQRALAGHDRVVCLSDELKRIFEAQFTFRPGQLVTVPWGIDLSFFDARRRETKSNGTYFISAGKTDRDFETLSAAFEGLNSQVRIFCSGNAAPHVARPNVTVRFAHPEECDGNLSFDELAREYESSIAVCIPLSLAQNSRVSMFGLTSLLEAMAFAKPVIMTRNPVLAIDVEQEGIGFWVDEGDVGGWRRAIQCLESRPQLADAMGRRARALCEKRFNITHFSAALELILGSLTKTSGRAHSVVEEARKRGIAPVIVKR